MSHLLLFMIFFYFVWKRKKTAKNFLMNFWPENFFYKCTQQEQCEETSDGFHVQIDKFSSFCINYNFLTQKKSSKVFPPHSFLTQSVRKSKLELVVWVKSINEWGDKEMRQSLGQGGSRPYKLYSIKAFPFLKGKLLQSFWCFFYSFPIVLYVFWPIHKK